MYQASRLSLDTTFLIDLQRERTPGQPAGPAHRFLGRVPNAELLLSVVALGEFAEGFNNPDHPIVRAVREHHALLPVDVGTAEVYARVVRALRSQGRLIGTNDLWIAASSLQHGLAVVTANVEDFRRVSGLEVIGYLEGAPPGEPGGAGPRPSSPDEPTSC